MECSKQHSLRETVLHFHECRGNGSRPLLLCTRDLGHIPFDKTAHETHDLIFVKDEKLLDENVTHVSNSCPSSLNNLAELNGMANDIIVQGEEVCEDISNAILMKK